MDYEDSSELPPDTAETSSTNEIDGNLEEVETPSNAMDVESPEKSVINGVCEEASDPSKSNGEIGAVKSPVSTNQTADTLDTRQVRSINMNHRIF